MTRAHGFSYDVYSDEAAEEFFATMLRANVGDDRIAQMRATREAYLATTKRRDELQPGDAFKSSHGYVLHVTRIHYSGSPETPRDERTVQVWGNIHRADSGVERTEAYRGCLLVELVACACAPLTAS